MPAGLALPVWCHVERGALLACRRDVPFASRMNLRDICMCRRPLLSPRRSPAFGRRGAPYESRDSRGDRQPACPELPAQERRERVSALAVTCRSAAFTSRRCSREAPLLAGAFASRFSKSVFIARMKITTYSQPDAAGSAPFFRALVVSQQPSVLGGGSRQRHLISQATEPVAALGSCIPGTTNWTLNRRSERGCGNDEPETEHECYKHHIECQWTVFFSLHSSEQIFDWNQ